MALSKVVPSNSKVADKTTREELNKVYTQVTVLIEYIRTLEQRIAKLEGQ